MFHFSWSEFVESIDYEQAVVVKYEDLLEDTVDACAKTVKQLTNQEVDYDRLRPIVEKYSFATQSTRKPGEEQRDSFLRKGIAGDWKEKFPPAARKVFDSFAGDALITAGYETDHQWVSMGTD